MATEHGMIQPFVARKTRDRPMPEWRRELTEDGKTLGNYICGVCGTDQGHSDPYLTGRDGCIRCGKDGEPGPVISYGCSSYGYDLRVARTFQVFTPTDCVVVDPKNFNKRAFVERTGDHVLIPPNSFALGYSVERFQIPRNVIGIVVGKSTYARCGIIVHCTPMEPSWRGHLTIEISNTTPLPAKVYAGEGLCQCLFFASPEPCDEPYGDDGKYQNQPAGVTLPR